MSRGAIRVSHARIHAAGALVRGALASFLTSSGIAIHAQYVRRAEVGQALVLDTLHKRGCEW